MEPIRYLHWHMPPSLNDNMIVNIGPGRGGYEHTLCLFNPNHAQQELFAEALTSFGWGVYSYTIYKRWQLHIEMSGLGPTTKKRLWRDNSVSRTEGTVQVAYLMHRLILSEEAGTSK